MKRHLPVLFCRLALGAALVAAAPLAQAQVWAVEGLPWQFQTAADKANKAVVLDIMERKKGGYYDSFNPTYNTTNNTYIRRQYNCGQTSTATGSAADSGQQATVSSPDTRNTSGNDLDSIGNTSSTGPQETVSLRPRGEGAGSASASTDQANSGPITSQVTDSPSFSRSAPINASRGRSEQALNVHQRNSGTQTASVQGSTACDFGTGGGVALN